MPKGTLEVPLVSAQGLENTDFLCQMDLYSLIKCRTQQQKSSVASNVGMNPEWNEKFMFNVSEGVSDLVIRIMDKDTFSASDFVGEESIPLDGVQRGNAGDGYGSDDVVGDLEENLHSPLLSRHTSGRWDQAPLSRGNSKDVKELPPAHGIALSMHHHGSVTESFGSMGIEGGWQLAWRWTGPEGREARPEEGTFKRMYLHQESGIESHRASMMSLPSVHGPSEMEPIQATALVSQPALNGKELLQEHLVGPAMVHPSETAVKGPNWTDIFEGGVKRALIVGIGIQILEQLAGINGVLYYTPQILEEASVEVLLANMGIGLDSTSLLISVVTGLLMLPCIGIAMWLMDTSGRRIPFLTTWFWLIILTVGRSSRPRLHSQDRRRAWRPLR